MLIGRVMVPVLFGGFATREFLPTTYNNLTQKLAAYTKQNYPQLYNKLSQNNN